MPAIDTPTLPTSTETKRGRGRPRMHAAKRVSVSFTVHPSTRTKLERFAKRADMSLGQTVDFLLTARRPRTSKKK